MTQRQKVAHRRANAKLKQRFIGFLPRTHYGRGKTLRSFVHKRRPRRRGRRSDWLANINPKSLERLPSCRVEPYLSKAKAGERFQFERLGYFCVDTANSSPERCFQSDSHAAGYLGEDRQKCEKIACPKADRNWKCHYSLPKNAQRLFLSMLVYSCSPTRLRRSIGRERIKKD